MAEKQRVLILSTSAGAGHKAAAAALEKVFQHHAQVEVQNLDALELTTETLRSQYADMYFRMVREAPMLVGWWYDQQNEPLKGDQLRVLWDRVNAEPLVRFIREFDPDITVCTHFMPAGIIAQMMSRGELRTHLAIVTTDYDFQGMWLSRMFNRYFVALEETKVHVVSLGIPGEHITVSGIPVDPIFGEPVDRAAVLARHNLRPDAPIILISAGAAGNTSATAVVEQLLRLENDFQAVVVCGRNDRLRRGIVALAAPRADNFRVLGYTDRMPDLLRVATLFVGKPGGMAASECMAAGVPMVIIEPIPGQEERNSHHLLEEGAAVRCNELSTVGYKIDRLLGDPARLERMRQAARALGRPDAAATIVDTLLREHVPAVQVASPARLSIVEALLGDLAPAVLAEQAPYTLYDDVTGILLGNLSEAEFAFLAGQLERESTRDDDYYINRATVELLAARGADEHLLELLRAALGDREEAEVRWVRRAPEAATPTPALQVEPTEPAAALPPLAAGPEDRKAGSLPG
jgi:processive 1,2-diacylglycerol beta-glucosyltransferase